MKEETPERIWGNKGKSRGVIVSHLIVVDDLNVVGILVMPHETHTPPVVNANAVLPLSSGRVADSRRVIAVAFVPIFSATCPCVRPARFRASTGIAFTPLCSYTDLQIDPATSGTVRFGFGSRPFFFTSLLRHPQVPACLT